jgi:hypothetical protein
VPIFHFFHVLLSFYVLPLVFSFFFPGDKSTNYANFYQGLWDCTGALSDELSFKRGDVIYILSKVSRYTSMTTVKGGKGEFYPFGSRTLGKNANWNSSRSVLTIGSSP